jgi:hypothetical protein
MRVGDRGGKQVGVAQIGLALRAHALVTPK